MDDLKVVPGRFAARVGDPRFRSATDCLGNVIVARSLVLVRMIAHAADPWRYPPSMHLKKGRGLVTIMTLLAWRRNADRDTAVGPRGGKSPRSLLRRSVAAFVHEVSALAILMIVSLSSSHAEEANSGVQGSGSESEADWSTHFQFTAIGQGYPRFHSPFVGPNSLDPGPQTRETISGTAFLGRRLWEGGALYINPEVNQGFGLSHTLGVAGFPNGEAQKAGFNTPKPNVARLFLRQTFGLGGEKEQVEDDLNQIAGAVDISRVTVTAGKIAQPDIFDTNRYAHDPRADFMNWSIWESAAWDYGADQKGYTDGVAVDLNQKNWALRGGGFLVPKVSNSRDLEPRFWKRFSSVIELETRHEAWGEPGAVRYLLFANRAFMGKLQEAADIAAATGTPADIVPTRHDRWKAGFAINLEQAITGDLGVFSRFSWNDGHTEIVSFTDIDSSLAAGASLKGTDWGRPLDTVGVAGVINELSKAHRNFFAAGGLGILIGDGRLDYAPEGIIEAYYAASIVKAVVLTLDYQFVANPAYNRDRGPVHIFAARFHAQF